VLFFSGSTLGSLKPCGCSGGQLGGLEKRAAIFDEAPAAQRLVLDTGSFVETDREQDLIKLRVLFEAFGLLGYDAVSLTRQDVDFAGKLGLLSGQQFPFEIMASDWGMNAANRPRRFTKAFAVEGGEATVQVATFDALRDSPAQAASVFGSSGADRSLGVLVLHHSDNASAQAWIDGAGADCVVLPSAGEEPQILSEPGAKPLVFTVGHFGRYICRVDADFARLDGDLSLHIERIPVAEDLPEEPALVRLYKQYQQIVSDSDLLEKYPRVPLPDHLKYRSTKSCVDCHFNEYALWSTNPHGDAYATLVEVGSDRDPECVVCHVVGMDYESGFVSPEKTPQLKNVGCEVCHGPGSAHNAAMGYKPTTEPKSVCLDCHTPEHSSGYAGHEDEYREKIMHWWEP